MKKNLYELFDSASAAELEAFPAEETVPLPEGASIDRLKSAVFQKTGLTKKKRSFRWQPIAAMAAGFCLLIALWGIGQLPNTALPEESSPNQQLQHPSGDTGPGPDDLIKNPDFPFVPDNQTVAPGSSISLRSLDALEEMRTMVRQADGEELERYLSSIEGGGARSREDLKVFLKLVDSVPVLPILDGTVTWISRQTGTSVDTGEDYDVLYLSTQAENGEWTRIEYFLSAGDIRDEVARLETAGILPSSAAAAPLRAADGRVTVYGETRELHASGSGELIRWYLEVDGIFAQVVYYAADAGAVSMRDVFTDLSVGSLSKS